MSEEGKQRARGAYWRSNLRLLAVLLTIWFGCSFGLGILFVEPLNQIHIGGFPLGFWFAQQGSIYTFIVLIFIYAVSMDRVDRKYRSEREAPAEHSRSGREAARSTDGS